MKKILTLLLPVFVVLICLSCYTENESSSNSFKEDWKVVDSAGFLESYSEASLYQNAKSINNAINNPILTGVKVAGLYSGIVYGATLGSTVPVIGTAVGAIAGGVIVGGAMVLLPDNKKNLGQTFMTLSPKGSQFEKIGRNIKKEGLEEIENFTYSYSNITLDEGNTFGIRLGNSIGF